MLVSFSIILIIELSLFLTSIVSKICCFSEIVAVRWDAILSAMCDALVNFLILLIVSLDIFLLIEVSFSSLLTAVIANGIKSSSLVTTSCWWAYSQIINFSLSLKSKIFTLLLPSTKTFTVPSGNFSNCKILPSQPYIKTSVFLGSSISEFFCVTRTIFLSFFITSFKAAIDLSLPTNKGITIFGNTTISLNGNKGRSILTSII